MDPVSELLAQPFRLEKTTAPTLSDVAVERMNTVREYAQSEKLPYMTYDQVMSKASDVYSPSDFATVGQRIRDNVVKAIETRFPVVGEKYTLKVENVHYEKPKQTELKEEKEVILKDGSLNDRLKGTWVLYDNATGKEVSRKNATLLNVPRMTSRGTFIRNGSEIGLKHMFRLRSGVYTHIKNNGRVSAHINPEQTTGQQMSVEMEPSTGVFSISRGTRTYGLLPILKAAGVPDDVVKGYMGDDLYKANYAKYGKLMGSDSQMEEYRKVWAENMAPIKLDAETTESTLGKSFSKMDPDVLIRASGRILQVSRTMSDNDTDDRDSLRYQRVMGPADYIPERIVRDGGGLLRKLFNTVTKSGNLDAVVTGAFQPHVDSVFLDDKHAGYIDGSSPMEALDFANMISRIGEGGIGSLRAAPAETRGVNDSYLGFIDPIRCYSRNHEIMTSTGWKNITAITMDDKVACLINGAVEYHKPDSVHEYEYNQDLYCYSSKAVAYEVTGNHRMWVCKVAHKGGQKKRGGYQKEYKPSFMFETAEDMHNTNRRVMTGGHAPYTGCWESRGTVDDFNYEAYGISQVDWAAFMGWYLSEGSTLIKNDKGQADRNCAVSISQTKAVHPKDYEDICQLLSRLPWSFRASKQERSLCIKSYELAQYLRRFGYCNDKYIPAQIFDMSVEARKAFMDAMMRGDGRQPQGNEGWVYTTTSEKLASGVERMLFDLGHCATKHMYEDKRTDWYLPVYEVRATVSKQGWLIKNGREVTEREKRSDYYKRKPCDGKVFCVTVPGGMVYTRIPGHKGFWCGNSPESLKVGLDIYLTHGIMKDSSGRLYNKFKDKKGTPVVVPMDVTSKSIVATPEFYNPKGDPNEFIPAMYQGKGIEYVKRKDVDFYVDNSNTMMSVGAGMIPLIGGIRSNRTLMGCLTPDTMIHVCENGELMRVTADSLLVSYANRGVLSLSDDRQSLLYRGIRGVVKHYMKDFNDTRIARVDVDGLVALCTMDHKWLVIDIDDDTGPKLITTAELYAGFMNGTVYKLPHLDYPHKFSPSVILPFNVQGSWERLSSVDLKEASDLGVEYVIDIDVDDNVYMLANGLFTHNSKYANQAVALQDPEAPLVQRKMVDKDGNETTTEKFISRQLGAKYAPVAGKVLKVDADSIVIAGRDGQKHTIDLYNEYPANQKGFIHNTALVKPGDTVAPNQILAKSNYTDDEGTAALGTNLRVAFLTGRNAGTFEDSITISESAAKKMSSTQLYKLRGDTSDDIEYSKRRYLSLFKDDFTPEQLDKIDENGLPKPGVVFQQGDPVYLGIQTRDIGVHGLAKNAAVPYVTRWEHSAPGTVTNVVQGKKHLTVYTKAVTPMEIGDKLCFDDQTEILTDKGWKLFKDLDDTERVLTMDIQTCDTWMTAYSDRYSYKYKGKMYSLKTKYLDICTTPDHEHLVSISNHNQYVIKLNSKKVIGKKYFHIVGQDVCNPHNYKPSQTEETEERWIDYDGRVYCVTVPYTHTVFVRRNGKTVWSGNSSRYGAKGTVGSILPDEEMPKDSNGNTFDVLQSPLSLPSRLNTSMLAELALAKIARKHGIKYQLPDFIDESIVDYVDRELKKHGVEPDEDIYDPVTGKTIPSVQTGELFFYKLKHMAELKERGRSTGTYSAEDVPLKGEGAARRLGGMESSAVFSGGGMEVLRDAKIVRGQRNDEFWRDYRSGKYPETPGFPLVHQKFFAHLKAAGVNLEDKGDRVHLYGATDANMKELTGNRRVTKAATFESKNMQPIAGGLFDPTIFGADGDQWGYVDLPEPVLNPIMFKTVGSVLGWKDKELTEYLEGSRELNGKFGTQNLIDTLNNIDLPKELARAKQVLKSDSTTLEQRDMARKRIRAIEPMIREGKKPSDFFFTRMPILPPRFRPVTAMSNGVGIAADANFLYKRMMDAADDLREAKEVLPEEMQLDARKQLYSTVNAVTGLTPTDDPKLEAKGVAGVLKWAFGKGSPKAGSLHRKVFGANLDLGSLGTITPDNSLTIDQVGIPERSAWKMFEPFVVRKLVQQGASVVDAMKGVLDQTDEARRALIEVMKDRPVLLNRAPTLWRYGIQGMYPVLVEGNALRVNPNVCKLFGADFDGNCLDFDSKIFVKLSQSALDFFERAMYINSNANQEGKKEENMSVARESLFGLSLSEGVYLMSIGKFPKVGEPFKDKNGADVYGLPSGIEVLSADPVTGEHKFCKVTSFTEEKDCECVEVTIDSRKVVVSSNATMAVFDHETGKLVKVPASEHNDRLVPVFKQCPVAFGDKYNRDFGWWLGALISDGWVTDRTVGYTKVEDNKRAEFIRIARTIHENFVANEYRSEKSDKKLAESVKVHLNGTDLAKKCMEFGIYADETDESIADRAALRKQIPYAMIHNGSEEFLYGLLSGLLDGDGSISKNTATKNVRFSCRLSTSSPYLRETFEILLYRLGLRWSTTVTPPRGWSKESYSICPSTVDMCSILDKLSCIGEKETALITEWKDNISAKDDKDIVPISRAELDALKKNKLHTINMSLYDALNRRHASTRALAMKYVDFLKQHAPEFVSRLYMTNTLWRPISSVEDAGKRDVYDFAVPDTKVFAANTGVVIYDSMTTHVPVSKEAVKAIDEKMLPSRNLLSPIDMKAHFIPVAEFTQGLYLASRTRNEAPIRFKTKEDMMAALNRGEIQIDTPVVIG